MGLGYLLRGARRLHGLSVEVVAEHVGVSTHTIYNYERERTQPTLARLALLAEVLDAPYGRLHLALLQDMMERLPVRLPAPLPGIGPYAFSEAMTDLMEALWPDADDDAPRPRPRPSAPEEAPPFPTPREFVLQAIVPATKGEP